MYAEMLVDEINTRRSQEREANGFALYHLEQQSVFNHACRHNLFPRRP